MDHNFTELIKKWLETPEGERDYSVGALYLLKLSGNRVMYFNTVTQIDRKRPDYDSLPDEIKAKFVENLSLLQRMRELYHEKYLLINNAFAAKQRLMPFFNRSNNKDMIIAIQSAGVSRGRNGFRKDKSCEKLPEYEEDLLEQRTDGSDAFDTLYIGCEKFPIAMRSTSRCRGYFDPCL